MTDADFVRVSEAVAAEVALQAVYSIISSLHALDATGMHSAMDTWVARTYARMSSKRRHINRLLMSACYAFEPVGRDDDFSAFIDDLDRRDAVALRDRALEACCDIPTAKLTALGLEVAAPQPDVLVSDRAVYLDLMRRVLTAKDKEFDEALYVKAHALFSDPPALKDMLISHLRFMWDHYLAEEWERKLPLLEQSVAAFSQVQLAGLTAYEAIQIVTGRDLRGHWDDIIARARRIIFIPAMHISPFVMVFSDSDPLRMVFGARLPQGVYALSHALSISELVVRLNALSDDTRLRILQLLTRDHELCAQDIMNALDLSQSAASRHLRLLTAAGYLKERRREVAKCYTLNPERVNETLHALHRLLSRS